MDELARGEEVDAERDGRGGDVADADSEGQQIKGPSGGRKEHAQLKSPSDWGRWWAVCCGKSPRRGIALAPYHLQIQKASVPEAIRICGRQLLFFYAWQHYPDSKQLPGVGPTDMTPWIRALAEVRYRGYVNPFMHGHPEPDVMSANLAKARNYLKDCYSKSIKM